MEAGNEAEWGKATNMLVIFLDLTRVLAVGVIELQRVRISNTLSFRIYSCLSWTGEEVAAFSP